MAQERRSVAAIILAAGRSSRMGSHKLLLPFRGRPIVNWVLAAACASQADPVIVIIGHEAEKIDAALRAERWFLAIHNPWYVEGMSTSLRIGLAATPKDVDGAMILLGDQPLVTPEIINTMIAESTNTPDAIIAASYQGQRGNPVLFPRQYFGSWRRSPAMRVGAQCLHVIPTACVCWKLTTRWRDSMWTRLKNIRCCSPSSR